MSKLELVFVPAPAIGHLVSLCKFAETLLKRDERLCVTILIIRPPPPWDASIDAYIRRSSYDTEGSQIRYMILPQVEPPSSEELAKSFENYISLFIANYRPLVKEAIVSNKWSDLNTKIVGLVIDMFCSSMIDVANELDIPSYLFFTSGAGFLGFLFYMSVWHDQVGREFNRSDADLKIAAYAHPVPSKVLPNFAFVKEGYDSFRNHGVRFKETKGILINTVAEFESHAVNSLASDPELPPVYTVGFLLDPEGQTGTGNSKSEDDEIMKWLDQQPPSSVLFLCFGTRGNFEPPQLIEMAIALERSEVRFLWSIRLPVDAETTKLDEILPEGFLERTKDRGIVCGWAPQVDILEHKATGAFVSHCGWNSTVESLWHGVPIVTWPLYAEQSMNAFQLVRDVEMAVELRLDYRMHDSDHREIVTAEEMERAIRCIMDSENPMRKRVEDMGEICRKAQMEGGSSFISVGLFVETILDS
ncbi:putative 36.4 kDa proline-rich protein-like [Capsicum annuum]|uniref:UDP-glycosyltransferase 71K1 n=1 Tax=Capsicum annuum TaxID=4072 RepID=UPI001FB17E4F|nr:UDP-glycosyltransferase 71K1 [Capsicum annuum]KAF3655757.1 putative 36.4 kDa proline-rich protein-like [Capsicum annuum]KAF3686035.1 putative 36.4 kDa proline-rich protein-like [Capsicum annuum]